MPKVLNNFLENFREKSSINFNELIEIALKSYSMDNDDFYPELFDELGFFENLGYVEVIRNLNNKVVKIKITDLGQKFLIPNVSDSMFFTNKIIDTQSKTKKINDNRHT